MITFTAECEFPEYDAQAVNNLVIDFSDRLGVNYSNKFKYALIRARALATLETYRSVHPEMIQNSPAQGMYQRRVMAKRSWENIQGGRGAGLPMPPEQAMVAWFNALNIPQSAWFAVRLAISRRGIKPRDIQGTMMKDMQPISLEMCNGLAKNIVDSILKPSTGTRQTPRGRLIK